MIAVGIVGVKDSHLSRLYNADFLKNYFRKKKKLMPNAFFASLA
jgi:hypothetical protein